MLINGTYIPDETIIPPFLVVDTDNQRVVNRLAQRMLELGQPVDMPKKARPLARMAALGLLYDQIDMVKLALAGEQHADWDTGKQFMARSMHEAAKNGTPICLLPTYGGQQVATIRSFVPVFSYLDDSRYRVGDAERGRSTTIKADNPGQAMAVALEQVYGPWYDEEQSEWYNEKKAQSKGLSSALARRVLAYRLRFVEGQQLAFGDGYISLRVLSHNLFGLVVGEEQNRLFRCDDLLAVKITQVTAIENDLALPQVMAAELEATWRREAGILSARAIKKKLTQVRPQELVTLTQSPDLESGGVLHTVLRTYRVEAQGQETLTISWGEGAAQINAVCLADGKPRFALCIDDQQRTLAIRKMVRTMVKRGSAVIDSTGEGLDLDDAELVPGLTLWLAYTCWKRG